MLKKMAEGSPISRGDFEAIQSFVIGLQCKFELAKGKGDDGSFDTLGTYYEILRLKLPHLVKKWSRRFEHGPEEVSFKNFTNFVMEVARVQQTSATILKSTTDKAKSPLEKRKGEAMGLFASGHPDVLANEGRGQEQRRPRSDERNTSGYRICSKEHQVADCEKFLAMELDERVDICNKFYMCFKCLDDTTHNFADCSFRTKCDVCPSIAHHTLLHGIRRFHPSPNHVIPTSKSNPL
jgi:hypothetical protein